MNHVIKIGETEYERDSPKEVAKLLALKERKDKKKVKKEG